MHVLITKYKIKFSIDLKGGYGRHGKMSGNLLKLKYYSKLYILNLKQMDHLINRQEKALIYIEIAWATRASFSPCWVIGCLNNFEAFAHHFCIRPCCFIISVSLACSPLSFLFLYFTLSPKHRCMRICAHLSTHFHLEFYLNNKNTSIFWASRIIKTSGFPLHRVSKFYRVLH